MTQSSPNPDNHPHRLRISYGPRMIFAETVTSVTITNGSDGTLKLEATYTPAPPEHEHDEDGPDVMPGWANDNPGIPDL
jgi:hypothetical protein